MNIVAVYNNKGGVGKTVTAGNLAYNLTLQNKRVLMVDMDPQGNLSAYFDRYDLNKNSVYDLLSYNKSVRKCRYRTKYDLLDIIPSNIYLANIESWKYDRERNDLVSGLVDIAPEYDIIIIDCPPSVGWLMDQALGAASDVIIPVNPDRFSADGLWTTLDIVDGAIDGSLTDCIGVLFTRCRKNKNTLEIVNNLIDQFGIEYFFGNMISDASSVSHAIKMHKPLMKCARRSAAARDYMEFTEEFLIKMEDHK